MGDEWCGHLSAKVIGASLENLYFGLTVFGYDNQEQFESFGKNKIFVVTVWSKAPWQQQHIAGAPKGIF